jgi:hypothetical protein
MVSLLAQGVTTASTLEISKSYILSLHDPVPWFYSSKNEEFQTLAICVYLVAIAVRRFLVRPLYAMLEQCAKSVAPGRLL